MNDTEQTLLAHILRHLREVQESLGGLSLAANDADTRFADALDSMALVEFLGILAADLGVAPEVIEGCVAHHFTTVGELAAALHRAGLIPPCPKARQEPGPEASTAAGSTEDAPGPRRFLAQPAGVPRTWLAGAAARLPQAVQRAAEINEMLHRPSGWLEKHAGIFQRRIWKDDDPLAAAAEAGLACLEQAGLGAANAGALLVTSEAPPLLAGLGAALHYRLGLSPQAVALEIGGACTGFLMALWTAQQLLPRTGPILVLSVEAPSRYLRVEPGSAGETAALFGDAAAAVLLWDRPASPEAIPLGEILLGTAGDRAAWLRPERSAEGAVEVHMEGIALTGRAIAVMAQTVQDLLQRQRLAVGDLAAVVAHGGNGRLPGLLVRRLGLPANRVWSETAVTGNLGSASLPVAWALHPTKPCGPMVWTAVGAGLTWGGALLGHPLHGLASSES